MTSPSPWIGADLPSPGGSLHAFVKAGRGDLAPVVLLHGAGANALTWTPIADAFGDRRVILVDMPGHGLSMRSDSWDLGGTAARVAEGVAGLLGDEHPVWGGHSWGGKVAGLVVAKNPAASRGLVLVDPSPSSPLPIDAEEFVDMVWSGEMEARQSPEAAEALGPTLRHWQPWNADTRAAFRHGLARRDDGTWALRPTRDDLIALASATLHSDASDLLAVADASVPTLLLIAAESIPWQEITNAVVYASATQVVVPGNHWLHLSSCEHVIPHVRAWLQARVDQA